ncbi:purine-binding chemotaxis protein CheW [Candidatus Sulfurimonas marisnigri]|uniref:Purine-binding chemotaxis protein CheW n=1 Tax=Candidatus Sulfurimonas marisnigri TaxID=2740405 RepID=A0A7S7M2F0_9BACT|nr:chemotaxis protein CheW [Candidatus Sulfurimonas marisnigri]QOY55776.1 purine-binding chemotaxis protein CheW [Candidatus Sulfurimonas marisnigri]QOY55778.1 purine-binding chemotaxis protein CheW [Candidatus Sulfurimonas marisnigri]
MDNKKKIKEISTAHRYLTFFVDDEQYGIDISRIKEIIAPIAITHIPKTPPFVKGVINLRGSIIPVVDVRLKFDMQEREIDINTAIIIYEVDKSSIGFIVDQVEDVLSIEDKYISDAPRFGGNIDTTFIENIAEVGNDVIMLLNLEKIFEPEELLDITKLEHEYINEEE